MALEARPPADSEGIVDAEIIEAEEVTRTQRARQWTARRRETATAKLTEQRAIVARRLNVFFTTGDVTDEQLARDIERKRANEHRTEHAAVRARVQELRGQMRAVPAGSPEAQRIGHELAAAQAQAEVAREDYEDLVKVDARALSSARWRKKALRLAGAIGVALLYVKGATASPLLALAGLAALPIGWWYLSRPLTEQDKQQPAGQTIGQPGATVPGTAGPAGTVPPVPYVPDTLASMSRVSLVKRTTGRVQGEADLVTALVKAGIITEAQRDETHLAGVIEPSGPGWTATVELPRGMKATAAISRVEEFASALRLKKSQIEMRADTSEEGHEGRFVLWVANEANPYGSKPTSSPLASEERWNLWTDGIPLGTDARGTRHGLELVWSSLLIGGLPGFGKSYLARLVAAGAALDPTLTVHVATGKPGPDWAPLKRIAKSYVAGNTAEKILAFLDLLNDLIADMRDIGERLEELSEENPELCPEGKLTPQLAEQWGRGLTLLLVDELQELLDAAAGMRIKTDDDPESKERGRNGKEVLVETMARFVRVSRYAGGMGLFITQRPDSNSVPTMLREVCAKRACFRVKGVASSKMVLGDDAVAAGAAPHMILDSQKGVVVLDQGGEQGHVTLKTDLMTVPEFREICLRGRDLRIEAGTLDGFAAEYGKEDLEAAARKALLDDCLAVLDAQGVDRVRTERLLELLADHRPEAYKDLSRTELQARLRDAGAGGTRKLGPIDGMANPNGYVRDQFANPGA